MITQSDIDQFYKDFAAMKIKKPGAEMKKLLPKLSSGNISEYLNKKKTPSEAFIKAFYDNLYKPSTETPEVNKNEPDIVINEALASLLRSNERLVEANLKLAEANVKITASHDRLVTSHDKLVDKVTGRMREGESVNVGRGISPADISRWNNLLGVLAEIGSGKRWPTKEVALLELNKFFVVQEEDIPVNDTRNG